MLSRFCLYGFLKNQRYYEPFLVLALLDKGLSFFQIGVLVAVRELSRNLLEIPSGAVADLYGRRRALALSLGAYILSFGAFGLAGGFWPLAGAMVLFGVGEAFRTGTHKAMIFTWLRLGGRIDEKTRIYGITRSWSQLGSALSVVLAVVLVLVTDDYDAVFFFSALPYAVGLINIMTYPRELEGSGRGGVTPREVMRHLGEGVRQAIRVPGLRRLLLESMGFEGMIRAAKDFLQPLLKATALALPLWVGLESRQRGALLIGAVYLLLHLGSAWASRRAHRLAGLAGGEEGAARRLWWGILLLYATLIPLLLFELYPVAIALFIALQLLQNLWRPILIARCEVHATERLGATILSLESQAKSAATMLIAPALGLAVDALLHLRATSAYTLGEFWPVAALGALLATLALARGRK